MKMRRLLRFALAVAVVMAAPHAWADQWYEHYARAKKALMDNDHATAITELNQAIERRGDSGARVRTYGMRVVDYFPYLKLGIAYFQAGEYQSALRAFDTEEQLGAVGGSEPVFDQLARFRNRATEALERQRAEQEQLEGDLIEQNLVEARDLRQGGRVEEAMAAVDRALALAPENNDAMALADSLREEVVRREDDQVRRRRTELLVEEGKQLRQLGRLAQAAVRFRQAAELAPESDANRLLSEVQVELAEQTQDASVEDRTDRLDTAEELLAREEAIENALGLVQQVLAADPASTRARDLERRLLDRMAKRYEDARLVMLLTEARDALNRGDHEGSIAAANAVLAMERGNPAALDLIQQGYAELSRRLLGEGPAQNLPPAIRFADMREVMPDESLVHMVRDSDFRLNGVIIDETTVELMAATGDGTLVASELSSQVVGGVIITEFRLDAELSVGPTTIEVVATDGEGLNSRSEYEVEYRRPLIRSPWLWGALIAFAFLGAAVVIIRRELRRRRLRRRRFNPYVAGPPVRDPELFVGRGRLLGRVLATVPNNSLLLLGERRIGKTSMLHQLRVRLPKLDHPRFCFVPVPIDLQGIPEEAFFATVAEAVGEAIGDEQMSAARAADGYDSRELTRDLRRVLPTIECADDKRAKLVLLLDEIDELNGYSHRTNQRLRSLFMRGFADQLVAVAAGVGIAREWDHEGSPWYNFFEELEVGPIDEASARGLATQPLGGVIAIDEDAVDRLLEKANGRPYILQKIALAAVQRVHDEGRSRITVDDVEAVV
jgi:tetratricopeptide (TPR) repeat protein